MNEPGASRAVAAPSAGDEPDPPPAARDQSRTRLVLARHGETAWSRSGRHTGLTDVPLTAIGQDQARRLGRALAGRAFAAVVSSPLARALDTCRIAGFGDVARLDPDLREWDYGAYEGRRRVDIDRDEPGWTVWSRPIIDGESLAEVAARADALIDRLLPVGGDVLVFSHGHLLRILAARWIEGEPILASHLELGTAAISELGWEADRRVIETWNLAGHLTG